MSRRTRETKHQIGMALFFGSARFSPAWYVTSGPTTNIPSRKKKCAIVQQTIWITDSVATCDTVNVHTINLHMHYNYYNAL